jgi:hypothetical protein
MGERGAPIPAKLLAWAVSGKRPGPVKSQNGAHRPSACHDADCPRPLCAAYREGFDDGFAAGMAAAGED